MTIIIKNQSITSKARQYRQEVKSNDFLLKKLSKFNFIGAGLTAFNTVKSWYLAYKFPTKGSILGQFLQIFVGLIKP